MRTAGPEVVDGREIPQWQWPSGRGWTAAITKLTPRELSERFGLTFYVGADDLDEFLVALLEMHDGNRIALFQHRHAALPGMRVDVDWRTSRRAALAELDRQLNLRTDDFSWVAESEHPDDTGEPER